MLNKSKNSLFFIGGILLLIFIALLCSTIGAVHIPLGDLFHLILGERNDNLDIYARIFFSIRLPRIALAIIVGAILSVCGAVLQATLRNPLAEPYILGVSAGATVGVCFGILLHISSIWFPFLGFTGALLTIALVYTIATNRGHLQKETIILAGVIVNAGLGALMMLLLTLAGEQLQEMIFLLMGNLAMVFTQSNLPIFIFISVLSLIGIIFIMGYARELNLLTISERNAKSLGVDSEKVKLHLFIITSIMIGGIVSLCGPIGFVGLIIPHTVRLAIGSEHRILLPASILAGAIFLLVCDTIARSIPNKELPVGVITALVGAPFFIYLLKKK